MENYKAYDYQQVATDWILEKTRCGLFLDMGLGKTICTLTAIEELMFQRLEIQKVLVIAPLRVADSVWGAEIEKWAEIHHLTYVKVLGSEKNRLEALGRKADIYLINRENVSWLASQGKEAFDFDMVIIDELSSFKSTKAKRFRDLKKLLPRAKRVVGLTGTPAPNSLLDLWPEIYLLDQGERLGKTVTGYRNQYFTPGARNGAVVYQYIPMVGAREKIQSRISDICLSMTKEDYLDMPDRVMEKVNIEMPVKAKQKYLELERQYLMELEGEEIVAVNAAATNTKLQQLANGAIYTEEKEVVPLHTAKLEALSELIEEANGQSVLVFYQYKHDRERIMERFPCAEIKTGEDVDKWNRGEHPLLIAHPASVGHGLNLQHGGHIIVWFGLTWSLELYQQANDRLYRNGQKNTVSVYHLVAEGTVDEACMKALGNKEAGQSALIEYLKHRKEKR